MNCMPFSSLSVPIFHFSHLHPVYCSVADTGGLQWFQLKPPLKERAPLISDDWYRKEQKSP